MATNSAYSKAVNELDILAKRIEDRRAMLRRAQPLLRKVDKRLRDVDYSVTVDHQRVVLYVHILNLDSFKDDSRLLTVLDRLVDADKIGSTDWPESMNRDYRFSWVEGEGADRVEVEVIVAAYVRSNSQTCRKVPIGTTLVEQTKYQIVCD